MKTKENMIMEEPTNDSGWMSATVKWVGRILKTLATTITIVLVILFLLSAYSDYVAPDQMLYMSYLGVMFPVFLSMNLVWMIMLLFFHCIKQALFVFLIFILAFEPVSRYFSLNVTNPIPELCEGESLDDVRKLKILTYNTCCMGQTHLSQLSEKIPVLDVVRKSDADIVCLQEYGFSLTKGAHTEEELRKEMSDIYPYYDFLHYIGKKALGIAVFSRYPIHKKHRIDTENEYFASMYYELDIKGTKVGLINNHLRSNSISPSDRHLYDDIVDHLEADSLQKIRTNVIRKFGEACLARAQQSRKISAWREQLSSDLPLLICGDMNDTPMSYCYHTMRGPLSDAWQDAGFGPGITFYQYKMWFRIDHIFHSKHLKALDIHVLGQYDYSDHYPILATFQLF